MIRSLTTRCIATVFLGVSLGLSVAAQQAAPKPQMVNDVCPGLASGALASAKLAVLPAGVLLRSGHLTITQKDIDAEIAKAPATVRSQLKNNAFLLLEKRATGELLLSEAKSWAKQNGRKPDEGNDVLLKAYFDVLTAKVAMADDEMMKFFDANKDMMGGATFDQVKDELRDYLLGQKRQQVVDAHINTMGDRTIIEVSKTWAARQAVLAMNNPVDKARKSGKPTMVDFGGEGCQPCAMMAPILASLKKEYSGKVNVLVLDVQKEQILAARFGTQAIPVQVFFDKNGKEVFRHVGFFSKEQIVSKLAEMGVK